MVWSSDDPSTKYIFDFLLEFKRILQPMGLNISYQNSDLYALCLFYPPPSWGFPSLPSVFADSLSEEIPES